MKEHIYNKLVRDNVPDIIREQGGTPVIRTLGDEEYVQCLENKLREEVGEFLEERTLDELGDIIEVLEELAHLQGWTDWEIRHARSEKAQRNGIFRERIFLEKVLEDCARDGQFLLTMDDAGYPARLRNIYDPPLLLYGKGSLPLFDDEVAVTVVGTRDCTPYGVRAASQLGYELARQGALLVSGMAKGIDGEALKGALRAGGFTAAVLGGGADVVYPAANRRLYEDIAATGVILSEYPPGTEPRGDHFPVRNRLLSALSLATVVVEAPEKSGALITAATALEQGREVFAVPGPFDAPKSRGCNALIREGAGLVCEAWDVLSFYESRFPHKLRPLRATIPPLPKGAEPESDAPAVPVEETPAPTTPVLPVLDISQDTAGLTDDQIAVLSVLQADIPTLTDDAALLAELPVRRVLSALTVLEIDGYVCRQGARSFLRTVELKKE